MKSYLIEIDEWVDLTESENNSINEENEGELFLTKKHKNPEPPKLKQKAHSDLGNSFKNIICSDSDSDSSDSSDVEKIIHIKFKGKLVQKQVEIDSSSSSSDSEEEKIDLRKINLPKEKLKLKKGN